MAGPLVHDQKQRRIRATSAPLPLLDRHPSGIPARSIMQIGVYLYGLGSVAAGITNLVWGEFESAHQPIQAWGEHIPGVTVFAYIAAIWLIAAGAAVLWRTSA